MNEIIHLESVNLLKERYYELKYIICVFSTLILFLPTPPHPLLYPFVHFPCNMCELSKIVLGTGLWVRNAKVIVEPPCLPGAHILVSLLVLCFHL